MCTITAMPSAKGLCHKAVVLSGATIRSGEKEYTEKLGAYVLKEAGLTPTQIGKLQEMPWKEFYAVATKAQQKLNAELPPGNMMRRGFSPFVDGTILPQHPYVPDPTPTAAKIPMMICSTLNEMAPSWTDASLENITLDQVVGKIQERAGFGPGLGEKAKEVVDAYAKAFPGKKPVEIWSMVSSNRQGVVALADAKSKQQAPVFVGWFCWKPPLFDNRVGAFHCVDICFWYANTDLMLSHTGGGARPRKLADTMSGYLVQFMKTGDPNGSSLQPWPKYTSVNGEVMVLDDVCEVKNDPDREARKALPS